MIRFSPSLPARRLLAASVFAGILLANGCGGNKGHFDPGRTPGLNAGNFTRTYYIGDSLTAGFQNGSLLDTQQVNGYANLLATQEGYNIVLPLIAPPGAPPVLQLVSPGPPPVIVPSPGMTSGRDNPQVQATDLAVPGHKIMDAISTRPSSTPMPGQQQLDTLVLGEPGLALGISRSQLEWANALDPTTVIVWIGNNDALVADETGMPSSMTSVDAFTNQFTQLMQSLLTNTRAHLIIANIPDVTSVPYLTPAATVLAETSATTHVPIPVLEGLLGIMPGDFVNPTGLAEIPGVLAGTQTGGLDDAGVLTAAEVVTVQSTVDQYNAVIAQQAQAAGATLVDIHTLFANLAAGQFTVNGIKISNAFLGGAFGLDGIHPSNTGYAILANYFIDTLNTAFHQSAADVDVAAVATADPLFPTNLPHGPTAHLHISAAAGKHLDIILKKR